MKRIFALFFVLLLVIGIKNCAFANEYNDEVFANVRYTIQKTFGIGLDSIKPKTSGEVDIQRDTSTMSFRILTIRIWTNSSEGSKVELIYEMDMQTIRAYAYYDWLNLTQDQCCEVLNSLVDNWDYIWEKGDQKGYFIYFVLIDRDAMSQYLEHTPYDNSEMTSDDISKIRDSFLSELSKSNKIHSPIHKK